MALKQDHTIAQIGSRRWRKLRERILIRDAYTCAYCGENANEVDHVIARKNGGTNAEENLVASCRRCNLAKGSRKGLFLGGTATPPVFASNISLGTRSESHSGPFEGQPQSDQTV